ncbi:MAG: hypothetical protein ACI4MJ_04510 [Aristaeellaceae bacterium]
MRSAMKDPRPQAEQEWSDRIPDPDEDEDTTPYEPTYRDGSPKHECWRDE